MAEFKYQRIMGGESSEPLSCRGSATSIEIVRRLRSLEERIALELNDLRNSIRRLR